jgi:hypothetical protein
VHDDRVALGHQVGELGEVEQALGDLPRRLHRGRQPRAAGLALGRHGLELPRDPADLGGRLAGLHEEHAGGLDGARVVEVGGARVRARRVVGRRRGGPPVLGQRLERARGAQQLAGVAQRRLAVVLLVLAVEVGEVGEDLEHRGASVGRDRGHAGDRATGPGARHP